MECIQKELLDKIKHLSDNNPILILNNEIISEQEFINSLLVMSNKLIEENKSSQNKTNKDIEKNKDKKLDIR